MQLGFGWSPAALPDDPIEDFSEPGPGLEPPKPEVRVERGEVPPMMGERPTSLPMTRAPTAEMTKQEAKARAPWWMGGEVSQEDEEFPPSSSGEWCASADDAAPVEDDDPVQRQREEVLAGQLVRRCMV